MPTTTPLAAPAPPVDFGATTATLGPSPPTHLLKDLANWTLDEINDLKRAWFEFEREVEGVVEAYTIYGVLQTSDHVVDYGTDRRYKN